MEKGEKITVIMHFYCKVKSSVPYQRERIIAICVFKGLMAYIKGRLRKTADPPLAYSFTLKQNASSVLFFQIVWHRY